MAFGYILISSDGREWSWFVFLKADFFTSENIESKGYNSGSLIALCCCLKFQEYNGLFLSNSGLSQSLELSLFSY